MAIWQYQMYVIPNGKIVEDKDFEKSISWEGYMFNHESIEQIAKVLQPIKSWSNDILQFGKIDETCIEIFYCKDKVREISVRVHIREVTEKEINAIVNFVNMNNSKIIDMDGSIISCTSEGIMEHIKATHKKFKLI